MTDLREKVARAIADVREGGWPADTYAMLQQHYLTMADAALAVIGPATLGDLQRWSPAFHADGGLCMEKTKGGEWVSRFDLAPLAPASVQDAARLLLGALEEASEKDDLIQTAMQSEIDADGSEEWVFPFRAALRALAEGGTDAL